MKKQPRTAEKSAVRGFLYGEQMRPEQEEATRKALNTAVKHQYSFEL